MKAKMSKVDVARCIQDFLDGTGGPWDWDEFICVPLRDPALEAVRRQCASLPGRFPPTESGWYCSEEGMLELNRLLAALRT